KFKMPGDECDLLAISDKKELVCLEVKYGNNGSIEWSPYQAMAYRFAFANAAERISGDIKKMVRQKVALGLVSSSALDLLPDKAFTDIKAAVVIGRYEETKPSKRRNLQFTRRLADPDVQVLEYVSEDPHLRAII
ncbi:MAG: hypothetical protein PSW75_07870, partial [bacterium]|nr:hypothetical protein [bacterium]